MKRISIAALAAFGVVGSSFAQVAVTPPPAPSPALASAPAAAAPATIHVPEGTEVRVRFEDTVTSKTAQAGDRFNISLDKDVDLGNGVIIPAGYRGIGEVLAVERHGFVGKAGNLSVTFDYIKVGDKRLHIRGSKGGEGKGHLGSAVALTILFGPLGLLARGADMTIPTGQKVNAYVDVDTDLIAPLAGPPKG